MMITQPVLSRILAFAAIAFLVGARSFGQAPVDGAPIPPISQAGSCEYDRLLQFVNIPLKALPEGVRLVQRVRTAPLVPFTHNPAVLVDLEKIKRLAVFFGIDEKTDLQSVRAAVAAIYQEGHPSREIGVYGLWFSDKNAANDWSKRLKADCEGSPFFLKDGLLLYLWKDDGVSDQAFAAMRNYLKVARLERVRSLFGQWTVTSAERRGQSLDEINYVGMRWTFRKDLLEIAPGRFTPAGLAAKRKLKCSYSVDDTKSPRHLNWTIGESEKKRSVSAIYELNDDVLTICFDKAGKGRPTRFDTKGSEWIAYELKRCSEE